MGQLRTRIPAKVLRVTDQSAGMDSRLPRPPLVIRPAVVELRGVADPARSKPDDDLYITFHRLSVALGYTLSGPDQLEPGVWQVNEAGLTDQGSGEARASVEIGVPEAELPAAFITALTHCFGRAVAELADWDVGSLELHLPVDACNGGVDTAATSASLLKPGSRHCGVVHVGGDVPAATISAGLRRLGQWDGFAGFGWSADGVHASFGLDRWDIDQLGIIANLVCQNIGPVTPSGDNPVVSVSISRSAVV